MYRLTSTLVVPATLLLALLALFTAPTNRVGAQEVAESESGSGELSADKTVRWYDAHDLTVEGQGWSDLKAPFDRLPAKAEETVRDAVWSLSRHSAGICVRFTTNAPTLQVRWELTSDRLAMPHMAGTGVSGVDLYVRDPEVNPQQWKWLAVGFPRAQENQATLFRSLPERRREFALYLPLYNGVSKLALGVPAEYRMEPLLRSTDESEGASKPIVFYGTSITQGGCASRTGMVHTAILGRRLDRPVINLGFSGNGRMELELADLMAELDPSIYVIDCLPNISADAVTARTEPLVRRLRESHPHTPIVLAEDRTYSSAFLLASQQQRNDTSREALRAVYDKLQADGVKHLYYLEGEPQLGEEQPGADNLGTVDGSHPTDLGFYRMADAFEKVLCPLLD